MESQLLLELIQKYKHIVECKETNKISSQNKNEAFEKIAAEYNANLGVTPRTSKQLRQKYLNLKKDAGKSAALIRHEIKKTGGGNAAIQKNFSTLEETVLQMGVLTQPLSTRFDSDTSHLDYDFEKGKQI